ncbi:MAG: hypothetical protein MR894_07790 [Akkermansia muciniphila]|nr:hypothetical protein [Akkermansia muciniphila]
MAGATSLDGLEELEESSCVVGLLVGGALSSGGVKLMKEGSTVLTMILTAK